MPIKSDDFEARVFGGYYDFDRDFGDDAKGWKARTELRVRYDKGKVALEIENLSVPAPGGYSAVDRLSLEVRAGEIVALLGENGAGKSTLVKCMMGFYQPTRGEMLIDGGQVAIHNPREASDAKLGMVYQHFTLVPSLTAAENLVVSRPDCPAIVDWKREIAAL